MGVKMIRKTVLILAFLLLSLTSADADIIRDISEAACRVTAGNAVGSGTAVFMDENNVYVLTNAHVVKGKTTAAVEFWKYGKKVPQPIPGNIVWRIDNFRQGLDFAIISVPKNNFVSLPNIIYFLPDEHTVNQPGTYTATAGCPLAQWLSVKEGYLVNRDNNTLFFIPTAQDGQSGSGLFSVFNGKTYIVGVVTARQGRGEITRDNNGFDLNLGVALDIKNLKLALNTNTKYKKITVAPRDYVQTSDSKQLYARDTSGKYWAQNQDGSVNVPPGTIITQWNCPDCGPPTTSSPQRQQNPNGLIPLPGPVLPNINQQPQQNNGGYGTIPPGFGNEPSQEQNETPPPEETAPIIDEQPIIDNSAIIQLEMEKATLELQLSEKEQQIIELQKEIELLKQQQAELIDKSQLEEKQKEIEQLNIEIDRLNKQIEELIEKVESTPVTPNETEPVIPNEIEPEQEKAPSVLDKAKNIIGKMNPLWLFLGGGLVGGAILKRKAIFGAVKKLFTFLPIIQKSVDKEPGLEYNVIAEKLSKLEAAMDYLKSFDKTESITNNINIDNTNNDEFGPFDYKKEIGSKPVTERIKSFFDLKKRDGESIEKWAVFAVLYKEAVQLLRRGYFDIDVVGNKVPLQGQRLAADKIDNWVREQFLKNTTIDKIDYSFLYHEAMIGFLYKEAVKLLRTGFFPILGAKDTADTIENWVRKEFLERMGITL